MMMNIVKANECGAGIIARKIADGRCVKTIVWINPILFEILLAAILPMLDMRDATAMIVPREEGGGPNLVER